MFSFVCLEKELGLSSCSRMNSRAILAKTSAGKERNEKRNSTGSAVFTTVSALNSNRSVFFSRYQSESSISKVI